MDKLSHHAKKIGIIALGWLLVALGLAALVLPGPGLLMLFAGMALLATQYEWAERRLDPIEKAAIRTATESVQSWPRIAASTIFSLGLIALGIVWGLHPATPAWWPVADKWWLVGGWGAGSTLILSGILAFSMIIYSYRHYR